MFIREDFLHFIWRFRRFDQRGLQTADGSPLCVIHPGDYNRCSGPDFSNSRISIGGTLWAGNVEIHLRSSDWKKHRHDTDQAYDNVILHVVFEHDTEIARTDGTPIPVLILRGKIDEGLFVKYHQLIDARQQFIPCENLIVHVDVIYISHWLERMLVERLENRASEIIQAVADNHGDWDGTFYQFLARNFGFKVNAFPFEMLARALPQKILAKHKQNTLQIEALVFGQAGLLDGDFSDEYPKALKKEFGFLAVKYGLVPVEKHLWKFFRLRPLNFPAIRLAQFAALIVASNHMFSKILSARNVLENKHLFTSAKVAEYWNNHYQFDRTSVTCAKNMGKDAVDNVLINTISPFLFAYGKHISNDRYMKQATLLLENINPEKNNIVTGFVNLGFRVISAQNSQALIELKKNYCDKKCCLNCGIGCTLLKPV